MFFSFSLFLAGQERKKKKRKCCDVIINTRSERENGARSAAIYFLRGREETTRFIGR
jgi:hypothetical protein